MTVRALVLGLVCVLAFILVVPTFRAYLAQAAQNAQLRHQVATAEAHNEELTAQLARWNDQAYVIAQARERLAYVLPGETAYRVVDPQSAPTVPKAPIKGSSAAADGSTAPWYANLWGSVQAAGQISGATSATTAGENGGSPATGAPTPTPGTGATGAP
ncbi:cell division protein FtsL [mine drainage metagenome]|uniref:Cell division protein FtsL n=1 Tax=mine drainage metagenome TaxID=410659 RepID=A0A1J5RHP8_9ZZZZ